MKRRESSDKEARRPSRGGTMIRRTRYLKADDVVDYRDYELLRKFMTERGKIMPRRFTGATAGQQRQIRRAIRRARVMGLLP
jgi:small subunit ribosomal protein S18